MRPLLVGDFGFVDGVLHANYDFDTVDQQGEIRFLLEGSLDLSAASLRARIGGAAQGALTLSIRQNDSSGCAFGVIGPMTRTGPFDELIELTSDEFCYGGGVPGRGTEVAVIVFASQPARGALTIERLELIAR